MKLSIAVAQMSVALGDPKSNLSRIERFVSKAKKQGADLVVFPEDAVCGPLTGQTDFVAHAHSYLARMQELAVKYGVDLVPGTWTVSEGGALYNQAHYITSDGVLAGTYRKTHLWETETAHITPGGVVSVFATRFGLVGMVICWDLAFPPLFTAMNALGVELVISPAFWSIPLRSPGGAVSRKAKKEDRTLIDSLCLARAFENDIVFVYCNAAGTLGTPEGKITLSGCSQVTHPSEKVISHARGGREKLLFAEILHQRAEVPA